MSPWAARCDGGPTGVCLSPPRKGDPGARLVIPRRGRRNPCVRSLRSYKVQFKKIPSSLASAARSRYTILPHFLLRLSYSSNKSRNQSVYPLTSLISHCFGFLFVVLESFALASSANVRMLHCDLFWY